MAYSRSYVDGRGMLGISWSHIIMFLMALFFFSKLRDAFSNLLTWGRDEKKEEAKRKSERQVAGMRVDETKLPKPLMHYTTFANTLYTAMDGAGTDIKKVQLLQNYTLEEFRQIFKEFDIKTNTIFFAPVMTGNLVEWLEYELNNLGEGALLDQLRNKFKKAW